VLQRFADVTSHLQGRDIDLLEVRAFFDTLIQQYGHLADLSHLTTTHSSVIYPLFEDGIVKIMKGDEDELTAEEAQAVSEFLLNGPEDEGLEEDVNSAENFIEAVKLRIARKKSRKTRYMNLAWIPATTCEVERLFSVCKHIYSEFRKAMTPETMEILLYLRVNRQYWNILTVAHAVNAVNDDDDDNEFHPQLVHGNSSDSDEGDRDGNDDDSEA